jgi:hypothetical protein
LEAVVLQEPKDQAFTQPNAHLAVLIAAFVGAAGVAIAALAQVRRRPPLLYLLSLSFEAMPRLSVGILLAGRAVLGGAESFIITGATTWGLIRVGAQNAGKVIAWMGTAMFAAFAVGAPKAAAASRAGATVDENGHYRFAVPP